MERLSQLCDLLLVGDLVVDATYYQSDLVHLPDRGLHLQDRSLHLSVYSPQSGRFLRPCQAVDLHRLILNQALYATVVHYSIRPSILTSSIPL